MKKVLVGVDGSENSIRALDFALDFSEKYNAELTIVNVSESSAVAMAPPEFAAYTNDSSMLVVAKDMHKLHEDLLQKAVEHAHENKPHVSITSALRDGDPASEIISLAKEGNFEIIVVGNHGVGKMKELLLGNISGKVAQSAGCTVVIVK